MSDIDSLIRERLDAAAALDVETDPQRVRDNVAHRQRRIRRRRRTAVLLGALAAAGVAVGVVRIVDQHSGGNVAVRATDTPSASTAPTAPSDDAGASPAAPPYFRPAPGWEAVQVGAGATAGNAPLGPDALEGNLPAGETIGRLEEGDVLLQAAFYPMGESTAVDAGFLRRELPLSLDDAEPGGLEGTPDHIYAERLGAQVNGWNIDLLIFYGGGDPTAVPPVRSEPTAETRAAAQEQLARLVVPARETPALSPAPEDACQPSNLEAKVYLDASGGTLAGHIGVRNIGDSACTLEGRARLVEPRDGSAEVIPSMTSQADPAWQQAGDEAPDGWPTIRIAPQSEAQAVLRIRNWCVEPGAPVYFFIRLPYHIDRIAGVAPSVQIPPQCEDTQAPMELALGPFEPPRIPE